MIERGNESPIDRQVVGLTIKMKVCFTAMILLLLATFSFGQVVDRVNNETAEQFAIRFKPQNSVITHNVIQTTWNLQSAVIAFYDQTYKLPIQKDPGQQEYHRVIAMMYVKNKDQQYNRIIIDTIDNEGGGPTIESVFFANADKDLNAELIIISSWKQRHLDVNGTLYGTLVYDNLFNNDQRNLSLLKDLSNRLSGGCECDWSDGTRKISKFKTTAEIKEELKRLGYKQL